MSEQKQGLTERTQEQVLAFMQENIRPEYDFRDVEYTASRVGGGWNLRIEQMYEYVPFDAEILFKVCKFFNTMNVNESRYSVGGCETCDYGSSYEITLEVREGKPYPAEAQL